MIDFTKIRSGEDFELLCEDLLRAKALRIVDKVARGPEGGKDLIISETVMDRTGHTEERKTLVQCKHHAHSRKAVGFHDVANWRDVCDQYKVNRYLLICSTVPTEDLRTKFQSATEKGDYVATIWARNDLERHLADHSDVRERYFPDEEAAYQLAQDIGGWLRALGYEVVSGPERCKEGHVDMTVEVRLEVPLIGKVTQRVLVRCIEGEIQARHVKTLAEDIKAADAGKGQLITDRRIATTAQRCVGMLKTVEVMTFDELIDAAARFDRYFEWLENEVKRQGIHTDYVDLGATKDDIDPETKEKLGTNRYECVDDYIDRWLDDPAKEHISILGEFGTGKTWFCLHYAWEALKKYQEAKAKGLQRPRLPIVIPLRDYAKAVSAESLFSEFFFRKHEVGLPGYSAFKQLNRMGKLLLIFDGFDEMANRINRQKQIDNFWELARVVVPGTKAILTCRSEHFEFAKAAVKTLGGEEPSSSAADPRMLLEPPRFEVMKIEKLRPAQIRKIIVRREGKDRGPALAERILEKPELADLAQRPGSIQFILAALPFLRKGQQIDLARVYLLASRELLLKNIREERTFTSMADKMHFLCELAWEMLSTGQLSLNFSQFPDRLRDYRPGLRRQEIDHWKYDLQGQTLLVRDEEGDYAFAHKSLPEFLVAYKLAAEMGLFHKDSEWITSFFPPDEPGPCPKPRPERRWREFVRCPYPGEDCPAREIEKDGSTRCGRPAGTCISRFALETIEYLANTVGADPLTPEVQGFLEAMVKETAPLWYLVYATVGQTFEQVRYAGGNAATFLRRKGESFKDAKLAGTVLAGAELSRADLSNANFSGADLRFARMRHCEMAQVNFEDANLRGADWADADVTGIRLSRETNCEKLHIARIVTSRELMTLLKRKGAIL